MQTHLFRISPAGKHFLFFILLLCSLTSRSQTPASHCPNADFETGGFSNWVGYTGYCCPVNVTSPGLSTGRHTIISFPGIDPNTCGGLQIKPPFVGNNICRLGNDNVNCEAERMIYPLAVDSDNALFVYRYAVVLEDPGHSVSDQPSFKIRVLNAAGQIIDPVCGQYYVVSQANIPGFQNCGYVRWKDWTTVGIDLSPYIGKNIQVEFTTSDCGLCGHFGYAYLDCFCMPLKIQTEYCTGTNQVYLGAPPFFSSYLWSTGQTTASILISNPVLGQKVTCTMKTVQSCDLKLTAVLEQTYVTAKFNYDTTICGRQVFFSDLTTVTGGSLARWRWDFGDGKTDSVQNPIHTYTTTGTYTVRLISYSLIGCSDTTFLPVRVYEPPAASFAAPSQCLGSQIQFTDQSIQGTGSIVNWNWDFGDGLTDLTQHPSHTYSLAGTYNVTLVIKSIHGCVESIIKPVTVYPSPQPNFTISGAPCSKQFQFTDNSTITGAPLTGWGWKFDDGSSDTSQSPLHTFPKAGAYNITLTVSSTHCSNITLINLVVDDPPTASFVATAPCEGTPVDFENKSTAGTGSITGQQWDFGDGTGSPNPNPKHLYSGIGSYNVMLIVSSALGCFDTLVQEVSIGPYPKADLIANDTIGCIPLCVDFTSLSSISTGDISKYHWDFGDGSVSDVQDGKHCYRRQGHFTVQLTITSDHGCSDSLTRTNYIEVYPPADAQFSTMPYTTTVDHPDIEFVNLSLNSIQWQWDFGDGSAGTNSFHTAHKYPRENGDTYMVTLIATSPDGCIDTIAHPVEIRGVFAFYVPDAFTPNGDGKNDHFSGYGMGISTYDMNIYNRWGKLVFATNNIKETWDGKVEGLEAQEDVYAWTIKLVDIDNLPHKYTGRVTLIRGKNK